MAAPSTAARRSMLAKVHIATKDLGIDDGTYRMMLDNLFGVESSGKLSMAQLNDLLAHLASRGFTGRRKGDPAPSDAAMANKPIMTKIGALLTELGQREGNHVPWSYAAAILSRQSGVMRLEWGTDMQLRAVVAALGQRIRRLDNKALAAGKASDRRTGRA